MTLDSTQVFSLCAAGAVLLVLAGFYYAAFAGNLIRALIGIEILMKAATLVIIAAGYVTGRTSEAQSFVITLIVIEVVVVVIASGVILSIYRNEGSIDRSLVKRLKG